MFGYELAMLSYTAFWEPAEAPRTYGVHKLEGTNKRHPSGKLTVTVLDIVTPQKHLAISAVLESRKQQAVVPKEPRKRRVCSA